MHRRKSSKDNTEQENQTVVQVNAAEVLPPQKPAPIPFPESHSFSGNGVANGVPESGSSPLRIRVNSVPVLPDDPPARRPPPGPYPRTSFDSLSHAPSSPLRKSFSHSHSHSRSHSRAMSSSGAIPPFAAPMLSPPPLGSFPTRSITMPGIPSSNMSSSPPESLGASLQFPNPPASPPSTRRHHHQRIHSRNLSVFFPRPGSLPASTIAEDGAQEIEITLDETPSMLIPPGPSQKQMQSVRLQDPPGLRRLGEGFTFGGRVERTISSTSTSSSSDGASSINSMSAAARATRRGHHHKHSLSHNFFSFLDPGTTHAALSTSPEQNWRPLSPFPSSAGPATSTFVQAQSENGTAVGLTSPDPSPLTPETPRSVPKDKMALSLIQFTLGAALWVSGQQLGSLACTGLGYWVVFDAFGVALRHVLPAYLSLRSMQSETRRPYGNARIETLLLFAQTIYLIFSSVYVCKETVEHLLLSAGDGHHHHRGDEDTGLEGMQFPLFLIIITIISLVSTCLFYDNHSKLLSTSGHKLPSFTRLLPRSRTYTYSRLTPVTPAAAILANPFTVAPLVLSVALVGGALVLPASQHQAYDLLLASLEAVLTFKIAYPAVVVQGAVLLQTAPPRGMPGARMEAFLRVMREIERHPLVLHLPAPHMWQLTPFPVSSSPSSTSAAKQSGDADALVVTVELHVRRDTDDGELVALTRWAHERCRLALGLGAGAKGRDDGAEITIGLVKG
ncbi:hypothetical protein DFH11DRAFT_1511147 [Phellopilus nigrolimitatus]|nr:hypothetical protein DFH11DRAFT_1511147 [Phellopilus nigrolimitatus]